MATTYTVISRSTSPVITQTIAALSHEVAVSAAITGQGATGGGGVTGTEYRVLQCLLVSATGPTGTYSATTQFIGPATGSTYSAVSPEDAKNQHKAAVGPTGPGGNLAILQTR